MKNFVLALLMLVAMLFAVSTADAAPRGFRPRSDFDAGFQAGARAASRRGGHIRNDFDAGFNAGARAASRNPRGVSPFNQDGGFNRVGRRR